MPISDTLRKSIAKLHDRLPLWCGKIVHIRVGKTIWKEYSFFGRRYWIELSNMSHMPGCNLRMLGRRRLAHFECDCGMQ